MMRKVLVEYVPGLVGGLMGGLLGYFIVYWIRQQGFYAPVIPGALAGLGCGLLSRTNSNIRGVLCALEAVAAGLLTEWLVFFLPREKSFESFLGFVGQLKDEPKITQILLTLGVFLGFWWGREATLRGRMIRPEPQSKPVEDD
jgi:hypothetical protein